MRFWIFISCFNEWPLCQEQCGIVNMGELDSPIYVFREQRLSTCAKRTENSSSRSALESTPPLSTALSAGRRPNQVCGNDTARAAEIFLHFSPSRSQTGWHWLESGAARQGQSMRIDRAVRLRLQSWKISRQLKRERERVRERRGCSTNSASSEPTSLQTNMLWLP